MRYDFHSVRVAAIQMTKDKKWWKGCGKQGTLEHCRWEDKLKYYGKSCGGSINIKNTTSMVPQITLFCTYPKEVKAICQRDIYIPILKL